LKLFSIKTKAAGRGRVLPGASKGGAKRGCGNFYATRNIKYSVSSVKARMGMEGQIMCIKMHILDVISSVSRFSKCIKIVGGWGFAPDPTDGAYIASTDT